MCKTSTPSPASTISHFPFVDCNITDMWSSVKNTRNRKSDERKLSHHLDTIVPTPSRVYSSRRRAPCTLLSSSCTLPTPFCMNSKNRVVTKKRRYELHLAVDVRGESLRKVCKVTREETNSFPENQLTLQT